MEKQTINLTGTAGATYDLSAIEEDNRTNSTQELVAQVYEYTKGQNPNPSNLKLGQIWVSKLIVGE